TIFVDATNSFTKHHFGINLDAASVSIGSVTVLLSKTTVNTQSVIDIASGAVLTATGTNASQGNLTVDAFTDVTAIDYVQVQGFSLVGSITIGQSEVDSNTLTAININGGSLINKAGDVTIATKTNSLVRTDVQLTVASGLTGDANAFATINTTATNAITLNNATIKGEDLTISAGRGSLGTLSDLEGDANTDIMAFSLLPNIATPSPTTKIDEFNSIDVTGNT